MNKDLDYRNRENYERMRENSLSERSAERIRERREKISREEQKSRMRILAGAVAVCVALAIGAGSMAVRGIQDRMTIDELSHDFQAEVIGPETHRTNDNTGYFYDYNDIANKIEDSDNIDEAIYLLDLNIGDYQTGLVLEHTDFKSFTHYKEVRGYESTEDFQKDMYKRVLLSCEIDEKQAELQRMNEEHPQTVTISYDKGGKQ